MWHFWIGGRNGADQTTIHLLAIHRLMYAIAIVVLLAGAGVVGDFFIKLSSSGPHPINWMWFLVGSSIYFGTGAGWFYAMKSIKLSTLGATYALTTVLLLAGIGVFYFGERLSVREVLGIATAVCSLVLLGRFA